MTDTSTSDLANAMSLLLEQELMASTGLTTAAPPPPPAPSPVAQDGLESDVLRIAAAALRLPEADLDPTENLANFGVDSIAITEVMVQMSRYFGISVAPTTFFEARHLNDLARILRERYGKAIAAHYAEKTPASRQKPAAPDDVAQWLTRHRAARRGAISAAKPIAAAHESPVAIISMAGKFPKSADVDALEAHLRNGDDCIEEIPADRWDWRAVNGDPRKGPFTNVKWGGFAPGVDQFDAGLFNIPPREAELMDPQHRLFLECAWTLIERAGYAPGSLSGKKVGVFLGINLLDYTNMANRAGLMEAQQMTGLGHAFCPNRLSFLLDVHGPSQVIDTACSSSLVAVHRAVMSIRHEGCSMAIAGGSNLLLSPDQHILFSKVAMLSPAGRCRTFAQDADGYARADGVGAVLLKRLDHAERDGDTILAVIRASAEHHGGTATSLTAPNPHAQSRLIVEAHRQADIDPRSVTMIECHGTGTPLGDPVEVNGLKAAFAELYRDRGLEPPTQPHCGLGSVKSNIGHTETAAGVAGLIKVLLAMRHGIQYRTLHCEQANPLIDLAGSPFRLLTQAQTWTRPVIDGIEAPRRAGLSSFGAGGTNVHMVLEEYRPASAAAASGPRPVIVPVSARSEDGLRQTVAALRGAVDAAPLDDLAYTLQAGRDALRHRVAFMAGDAADLARQMDSFLAGRGTMAQGTVDRRRGDGTSIDPAGLPPAEVAARWVTGGTIDWPRLHGEAPRKRLPLPSTLFAHKRYWLPMAEKAPSAEGFALREAGPDRWCLDLTGQEFFLSDHRLGEDPVLPGVAYLELARAAGVRAGLTVTALRNVVWIQPLMVTTPLTVEVALLRSNDGMTHHVEVASLPADGPRRLHAQIRLSDALAQAEVLDLAALQAAHPTAFSAERVYAAFDAMGLRYGPAHKAIQHLATGADAQGRPEVLARLSLPPSVSGTLNAFALHPSLLDGAFQAAVGVALDAGGGTPDGAALPFAIDAVEILGPCRPTMWVHVRPAAKAEAAARVRTLDLDLMDEAGRVCVRLRGFATRLPAESKPRDAVQIFAPRWQRPALASVAPATRIALLCTGVGDPAPHLPGWHCRAVDAAGSVEHRFQATAHQVLAALQGTAAPALVQLVVADGPDAEAFAGLAGMFRTAGLEQPGLSGQVVTVPAGIAPDTLAGHLTQAAAAPAGARLRVEDNTLWQETWEPLAAAPAAAPWQNGKVYLITGGMGGLGRQFARAIVTAAPAATVVLAGRSSLPPDAQAWLDAQGSRIEYARADLGDAASVATLVDGIRRRHGRLDGVVHAAGVLRDAPLSRKTAQDVTAVLAPKVAGAVNLDRAIGAEPLDFFVLFSSLSGTFGNPGQADYAAANGFLDGFAAAREVRRRAGLAEGRTVSVAWPLWADGGMTMDAATLALMSRTTGLVALETADGLSALAAALGTTAPRLLVAAGDAEKVRRRIMGEPLAPAPQPPALNTALPAALTDRVLAVLISAAARQLKVAAEDLAADEELTEYGFDSIGFTQFSNALNEQLDLELTPTVFFEYPTLEGLTGYLCTAHGATLAARLGVEATAAAPPPPPAAPAPAPILKAPPTSADGAVAIIGMSGIFPQAEDVEAFWRNLEDGRDCITEIPADRWNWRDYWGDPKTEPGRCNVRWGGFMDGIAQFDAGFFGLSAPEARMMDPQQRLLLTQAWRVMEDAGYAPQRLSGTSTGVFIGTADTGYGRLLAQAGAGVEGYAMTGLAPSLGPNRISFHFNLHGPSMAVETACSSALVAVHRAVEAIRSGHCDAALAGGINTLILPDTFIGFAKAGMLSPDGRSKPFASTADGYARGEGVGLVFLKRLSDAERDNDRIIAVIRASGENHGGRASSLTAPNPKAQAALLRSVYDRAGFDPRTVSYIEAHGTGTPLGDPIEFEALTAAFADLNRAAETTYGPAPAVPCGIGSVKSNIGHLELAAGIAGLIKVLLQMRHGTLVKTLHCETLNPYLKLTGSPFHIIRENQPWPRPADGSPRRAGVSSFGFGGANAHVVIEEYLAAPVAASAAAGPSLMVLSAHTPDALVQVARDLRDAMDGSGSVADVAYSLQSVRSAMEYRLAFAASTAAEAVVRLDAFIAGRDDPALRQGRVKTSRSAVSVLESDDEVRRAIAGLPRRGRADGLLELWVRGFHVDWASLYDGGLPRRVALPGYPLATTAYWPKSGETPAAPAAERPEPQPDALAALSEIAAQVLEVDAGALDPDAELGEFGFDSITMTGFAAKVNEALTLSLTPADFFEFATLGRLARHIAGSRATPIRPTPPTARPLAALAVAPAPVTSRPAAAPGDDPIAIVGFSCQFPQAADGEAFWDNLVTGRDCITRIPADRWDWRAIDGDPKTGQGKTNIHWGGFIDGVFEFDPLFFGISPREAKLMDPQQRLLMTHVWKAIEDSGHAPRSLAGRRIGLFVGTSSSGYREIIGGNTGADGYVATGAVPSVGPNRASYFLDWHGPSEPVETACSSSLVALHRAAQSMRAGDCDMAVVGGVNTIITPEAHINFAKAGMLSPDGRCKTFSAQANGYVRGEGVGMIVLKRLSDAQRDGDPILALVRASAINHGGRANSLTAPNTAAQTELLREAHARGGIDPATISYIEAHGTGTALGDPVEINALKAAFGAAGGGACGLGSVKSNIGHLELAAGVAGIIKVLLQMRHRTLVPSLRCAEVNPYIDLSNSPFRIIDTAQPWEPSRDAAGRALPLRAGISSFGFGGVNAHVILEDYQASAPAPVPHAGPHIIVLSARDADRLTDQARNLSAFIPRLTDADFGDLAYTLQLGRDAMKHRLAMVVTSLAELGARLTAFVAGDTSGMAVGALDAGHKGTGPEVDPHARPDDIAAHWVAGKAVNWAALHPRPRRRLRLPTYPFARDTYNAATPADGPGDFTVELEAEAFYLRDHRVRGARILPGAMGLELARAAFAAGQPFAPVTLSRVVWQHPLVLNAGSVTATVPLAPGDTGETAFRLMTASADSRPHMLGVIAPLADTASARMDLDALRQRCGTVLPAARVYATYAELGLNYGPSFQAVEELLIGDGEVLARLRLPTAASGNSYALHPSIVDGAFQAVLGLFEGGGDGTVALPFGLEVLEVLAPTTAAMWGHVRRRSSGGGIHKIDIDLADDDGVIRLRIRGFALRVLKGEAPAEPDTAETTAAPAVRYLAALVAREAAIPVDEIEAEEPLEAYGIDSMLIVRLTDALEQDFGPLPKTLFFEYRTLQALAEYFLTAHAAVMGRVTGGRAPAVPAPAAMPQPAAPPVPGAGAPVAIIGMSGRYPGARDLDEFWRNLEAGRDCITEIPADRWDHSRYYDPTAGRAGKTNSKWGGFIDGVDRFDPLFFNISPREAPYMDPQERLFLQTAWETLEDAGYTRATIAPAQKPLDGADVGVFVGVMYEEYQLYGAESTAAGRPLALSGSAASIANRVSYFCGFHGPSLAVDSMCSSSLTAIHLACESLRAGSCRVALAGGVNLTLHPNKYLALAQGRFTSSTGRCESFGQGGDGYVPGEGVGAVLLKPLDRAEADGDRILGVIRASALNHGGKTNGYTVPNPAAQAAVIGKALKAAGVSPRAVSYVEAHGTGTSLGDPIEIAALTKAYRADTADAGFCAIGSVKSNIGHCESAAGVAGLAKVLLQFRHQRLVPSLHSDPPNPGIDFASSPFKVQRQSAPWPRPIVQGQEGPRIAGLSSFGAGGSNAHLVLEEYAAPVQSAQPPRRDVFPLSARDPARLDAMVTRFRRALDTPAAADLAAIAHTLQAGREAFEERLAIVADSRAALVTALDAVLAGAADVPAVHRGQAARQAPPPSGDLDSVAAAWVRGARVDWSALRGNQPVPGRAALPSYPFAQERYWVPGAEVLEPAAPLPLLFAPRWRDTPAAGMCAAERRLIVLCEPPQDSVARLTAALAPAEVVVFSSDDAPLARRYSDHAARLLALLQGLFKDRPDAAIVQVVVPPTPDGRLLEGLAGMLRSARQERPSVTFQMVTLDCRDANAAALLLADQAAAKTDGEVRHADGRRQVRQWQELPAPAAASPWKADGVYLITGGAGGVGLHVCAEIAGNGRRPALWLIGRSPLSASARQSLDATGAEVQYRQVDVTDAAAVAALVAEIMRVHGRLNGVLHAAGTTRDMLLVRKTADDLHAVLAPKVAGAAALDAATAALDLDMMVLFASVSGALGNAGQADYATANAFLDAFASHRNGLVARGERRGRTVAIDWPYWLDGGMRLGDDVIAGMDRAVGARPLATAPALAALTAALALTDEDQVLVLEGDHDRLRAALRPSPAPAPAPMPAATPVRSTTMAALVTACFAEVLKIPVDRLAPDAPLDRFGMDSVSALEIVDALERQVGPLPPTILFEHPSIGQLSDALSHMAAAPVPKPQTQTPEPAPRAAVDDIAVLAVAGRYPGANTIEDLWSVLAAGGDCITEIPPDRWDPQYSPIKGKPGASHCKWGGFINDVACFDAEFFGYSPRAADLADPQERLFLETAWHLLERAGHTRARLRDHYAARVGVFVGAMYQHYSAHDTDADSKSLLLLNSYSGIANRVSYFFDLQGPSVAVDSMCSSGLQAVHQACQSLRAGECRLAIAGGVNLSLLPAKYQGLSRAGLIASQPGSRSFADGDGYLPAEGVGAVLLKPLADAVRDGDAIVAVIKGSAANHGGHSAGFGVPSADAQARLIEENLRRSGIDARTIGYVEAAASGATLGDAIEIRALTHAFRAFGVADGACAIGSVKTNMGHAEAASGLAQLTKVLLQLQHRQLAPSLKPEEPNTAIQFEGSPFRPQWQAADWPQAVVDGVPYPRRATVSSFGAGGSNVHLIVEEAPPVAGTANEPVLPRRFPLSARTPAHLNEMRSRLSAFLRQTPDLSLARLSYTLCHGREVMDHNAEIVASDRLELIAKLDAPARADAYSDAVAEAVGPPVVLPGYPFARERHWLTATPTAPMPQSDTLRALILEVLSQEVGVAVPDLSPTQSFTALGLDSMVALRLGYAIEEASGISLQRRDLEDYPTPDLLAARITALGGVAERSNDTALPAAAPSGAWRAPLTEGQKGLWVVQSLHPDTTTYNVPLAFRISGIDHAALERACDWLLEAYPVLTARVVDDGTDLTLVAQPATKALSRIKVPKGMDPLAFARQRAARPFDLGAEAPTRFELLHGGALGSDHEILLLTVHHMVFDGASAAVAATALWNAYSRFTRGPAPPPLPSDQADFSAFSAWERAFMASAKGKAQHAYWRRRLEGVLPVIDLPADRPAQPGAALEGRSLERVVAAPVLQAAKRTAAALGITPASLFLGVLTLLVYRLTGQQDMVVGVPTLRRPGRQFERAVGYFVNMLALRVAVSGDMRADAVLRDVHQRLIEGLDHGDYPFAAIARDLGSSLHGIPPYQISYAYQNFPIDAAATLPGGRATFLPEIRQEGDGPFGLELYEDGDILRVVAGFDGARFDTATVDRLLDRFIRLTEALCADPKDRVRTLEIFTPGERKTLLGRRAKPPALPRRKGLLPDWIAHQAQKNPDSVAVIADKDSLTYHRLVRRANRLARHLRTSGVGRGDAVAVLLGRGTDSIVALLATMTAGAVWVPLDGDAPARRLSAMLDDCGAKAVILNAGTRGRLDDLPHQPPLVIDVTRDADALRKCAGRPLKSGPRPGDPAYMIYTSGSTGAPKGVVVSHQSIADHCQTILGLYGLKTNDVVLQFAPHVVDTALEQILPTLAAGARLLMRTGAAWPPEELRRVLVEHRVTVADLPPAYLREVLLAWNDAAAVPKKPTLRLCIVGGEALPPDTVRLWQRSPLASTRLLNAYGPTEATITCLVQEVDATATGGAVPIGRPLPGTEAYILDRDGNAVPEGVIGELHIGGGRLAIGYHGRPDLTADRFIAPPKGKPAARLYRTGDMASFVMGGRGTIAFHGRVDDQVKIRGFRVELSEVETALGEFGLREAAVVPRLDGSGSSTLTAYVVPSALQFNEDALRAHMAARLPTHMLPGAYIRLEALPVTTSGKLDRAALPEAPAEDRRGEVPRNAVEDRLLGIWAGVLGRDAAGIGIHDDFQLCGGHSLLWVRLLADIGRTFGVHPTATDFLAAQTIAEQAHVLSARMVDKTASSSEETIVPLRLPKKAGAAPLFLVHPVAGTVSCYVDLARRLAGGVPVYGLQTPDTDPPEGPSGTPDLVQMAARHVRALRSVQPTGPYSLGGWSMGGALAFEMARQFRQSGEDVTPLILIDSYTPTLLRQYDAMMECADGGDPITSAFAREVLGMADPPPVAAGQDVAAVLLAAPELAGRFGPQDADQIHRLHSVYRANSAALLAYQPGPCDVPIIVLRASDVAQPDETCGWGALAQGGLSLHSVPGNHASVLQAPSLDAVSAILDDALARRRRPRQSLRTGLVSE